LPHAGTPVGDASETIISEGCSNLPPGRELHPECDEGAESRHNSDITHSSYDSTRLPSDSDREPSHVSNAKRTNLPSQPQMATDIPE
jgi:hypothetical protein